jgi:hypothetical protein
MVWKGRCIFTHDDVLSHALKPAMLTSVLSETPVSASFHPLYGPSTPVRIEVPWKRVFEKLRFRGLNFPITTFRALPDTPRQILTWRRERADRIEPQQSDHQCPPDWHDPCFPTLQCSPAPPDIVAARFRTRSIRRRGSTAAFQSGAR